MHPKFIQCHGIFFKETEGRKLTLEIEEIRAGISKNYEYYIDLDDRIIKKK